MCLATCHRPGGNKLSGIDRDLGAAIPRLEDGRANPEEFPMIAAPIRIPPIVGYSSFNSSFPVGIPPGAKLGSEMGVSHSVPITRRWVVTPHGV